MQNETIVEKGKVVRLNYETFVDKKLIDSSKLHKPLEIVFGYTKTSKVMNKNLEGQKVGYKFEINQKIDTKPIRMELNYSNFDDDTIDMMKKESNIEVEMNKSKYNCKVISISEEDNTVIVEYTDYFAGKTVNHKLEIVEIRDVNVKKE